MINTILFLIVIQSVNSTPANLRDYIQIIEQRLQTLAKKFEASYHKRCTSTCPPSYNACSTKLPSMQCSSAYQSQDCRCYSVSGRKISEAHTTVKLSNLFEPEVKTTNDVHEMICTSHILEESFKQIKKDHPEVVWQYFGSYNGIFRNFPGIDQCDKYDPRTRPWYVAAATNAKNLILVIDTSGSMTKNSRLEIAQEAAKLLVGTLNINDWYGLVTFSSDSKKHSSTLQRATNKNIEHWKEIIDNLSANGETNFEAAFRSAFEMLRNTKEDEFGNACESVLIFLTDGRATRGKTGKSLLNLINDLNKYYQATIFSYALGTGATVSILKELACATNGMFERVYEESNLIRSMNSYYFMLAQGLEKNTTKWTEPYLDANGMGLVTTTSHPVYDYTVNPPFLLGVVGIDLVMDDMYKYSNNEEILKELVTRSKSCSKFTLDECQLNSIRTYNCQFVNDKCTALISGAPTCSSLLEGLTFVEGTQDEDYGSGYKCCGYNECAMIAGVVIGSIFFVIILAGFIICYIKRKNKKKAEVKDASVKAVNSKPTENNKI